jgi:hypothetical protein
MGMREMPKLKLKTTHPNKKERSGFGAVVITTAQSTEKKKLQA